MEVKGNQGVGPTIVNHQLVPRLLPVAAAPRSAAVYMKGEERVGGARSVRAAEGGGVTKKTKNKPAAQGKRGARTGAGLVGRG